MHFSELAANIKAGFYGFWAMAQNGMENCAGLYNTKNAYTGFM
jgi:hypothetical protein